MHKGNVLALKGEHAEAIKLFLVASRLGVNDAIFNAGNSYVALGDLKRARSCFQEAGSVGVWEAWFNLGDVYRQLGRRKQALRAYLRAAAHGDPKGPVDAAWQLRAMNRPAEADHLLRVAVESGNDLAAGALGQILFEEIYQSDPEAGVPDHIESLLKRGSAKLAEARVDYALVLRRKGQIEEAISWLSDDVTVLDAVVMVPLSNLLLEAGRTSEARKLLRFATEHGVESAKERLRMLDAGEKQS